MNRRLIPALLTFVVATAFAVTARGSETIETVQGEVVAVDAAASAVAVQVADRLGSDGKQVSLKIADETKITKDGAPMPLSQLRKGDQVVVTYRTESEARIALTIGVRA